MTAAYSLEASDPKRGCTGPGCGTQATVQLHPHHGRRCPAHVTVPPGGFSRGLADDMCDLARFDCAFAYLAAWLARECDLRFTVAAGRWAAA